MIQIRDVKIIKIGGSYGFTIPRPFITNGMINLSKRYNIEIEEEKILNETKKD